MDAEAYEHDPRRRPRLHAGNMPGGWPAGKTRALRPRAASPSAGRRYDPRDAIAAAPPDDRERVWADLEEHGYAVVEDALSPDRLDRLRARLIEQAAGELAAGVGYLDPGGRDQRV